MKEIVLLQNEIVNQFFDEAHLKNRNLVYVFQSQMVSQSAIRYAAQKVEAVESNRFIAWDRFKERFLSEKERELRPISSIDKLFFANSLAKENNQSKKPLFKNIVPEPEEGKKAAILVAASQIENALNSLHLLKFEGLGSEVVRTDLQFLKERYDQFLVDNKLFDPETPTEIEIHDGKEYLLFYPELILDYENYTEAFQNANPEFKANLTVFHLPKEDPKGFEYPFYQTGMDEVRETLSQIKKINEDPQTQNKPILISLANEELKPLFEFYAPLYNVPLDFRIGDKLANYAYGSFFKRIKECVSNQFAFNRVRALLLNQSPAWKPENYLKNLQILQLAAENGVLVGEQQWKELLSDRSALSGYWGKICGCFKEIIGAKDFIALSKNVQTLNSYLDVDFSDKQDSVLKGSFQTIMDSISELHKRAAQYVGISISSPFDVWTSYLNKKSYLAKSLTAGIPVVKYRVGATAFVDYHFICGLSQRSSRVVKEDFNVLTEVEKTQWLNADPEGRKNVSMRVDASDAYLSAYAGGFGSCSVSGCADILGQPQIACSRWLISGAYQEKETPFDPIQEEYKRMKAGNASNPDFSLSQRGRLGQEKFKERQVASKSAIDYTKDPINNQKQLKTVIDIAKYKDQGTNLYRFSTSFLDEFTNCPFRSLLNHLLKEEVQKEAQLMKNTLKGNYAHKVLEYYYKEKNQTVEEVVEFVFTHPEVFEDKNKNHNKKEDYDLTKHISIPFVRELFKEEIIEIVKAEINRENNEIAKLLNTDINPNEISYQSEIALDNMDDKETLDKGYYLKGRVDKLIETSNADIFVDYKTGAIPNRKIKDGPLLYSTTGKPQVCNINSFQMLVYEYLLRHSPDHDYDKDLFASYCSLKRDYDNDGEITWQNKIYDSNRIPLFFKTNQFEEREKFLLGHCSAVKEQLDDGKFMIPNDREPICDFCPYKGICRNEYLVK